MRTERSRMPESYASSSWISRPQPAQRLHRGEGDPPERIGSCFAAHAAHRADSPALKEEADKTVEADGNSSIIKPVTRATVLEVLQAQGGRLV